MKTCPPEVFWSIYHIHKFSICKLASTFETLRKNDIFLPKFYFESKFSHVWSTRQVLTKNVRGKKATIFAYTTLTSDFSYLFWSRKYFVLKIKYTRIWFSNNYLHFLKKFWTFLNLCARQRARVSKTILKMKTLMDLE